GPDCAEQNRSVLHLFRVFRGPVSNKRKSLTQRRKDAKDLTTLEQQLAIAVQRTRRGRAATKVNATKKSHEGTENPDRRRSGFFRGATMPGSCGLKSTLRGASSLAGRGHQAHGGDAAGGRKGGGRLRELVERVEHGAAVLDQARSPLKQPQHVHLVGLE